MRSPLGSLLAAVRNVAPVPVGPAFARRGGNIVLGAASRQLDDEKLMGAYGSVGTLFAVVNRLASATASVEWKLWRKAKSGLKEDRTEVLKHAALDLVNKPNAFMPRQEFMEIGQQHQDLTGENSFVISYAFGIPVEMWPVRPDRLTPVPDPYEFIKGYIYRGPEGQEIPLKLNEVIQIRMPNPLDPYRGLGPVQSILTDLDSVRYSAEWNKNFFLNSAEPGGIIEVERRLGDDEFDEMCDRWDEQHRGVSKAHRVAIIEQGKWIDRKYTNRDMQFVELSRIGDDKVREAFGFPKAMQGIVDDVNRANAEAGEYLFARWLEVPRLERWKSAYNFDLLPLFGRTAEGLEFDYENPVAENSETANAALTARSNAAVALVGAGWDAAEVLEAVDLPPMAFEKPEPPAPLLPPSGQGEDLGKNDEKAKNIQALSLIYDADPNAISDALGEYFNAQKWEAVEQVDDDSICEPCRKVHGKTYKNREEAYRDYPNGQGYKDCVGAQYGNQCRGKVVKRKRSDDEA